MIADAMQWERDRRMEDCLASLNPMTNDVNSLPPENGHNRHDSLWMNRECQKENDEHQKVTETPYEPLTRHSLAAIPTEHLVRLLPSER